MDDMPDRFCDECGAANAREATVCFACARPLEAPSEGQDESVSDEEVQTSDTPVYLQITLSADSQRTIQFVQPASSPPVPLLHGRYKVLNQVGTGGFGAVYRARDLQANGRMVAIKAIELDTLSASQAIEATDTFNRELNLLSNLDHPHLPTIYEHFIDKNHWYLVMDFIEGEPLDEYLQQIQEPCLPFKQVINVGNQLCDVLRYLHQLHPPVIYRDLKPSNIMRTPGGRLYLIDFGIARRFKPGQTRDTTPLGSPGFAAPEQYGKAQTTPRSDIYSLGATLYFLLTGYDPANTPFHLPPIRSLCPTLPEPLADLLTSMLALDPADRPASIAAVQQVLNEYAPSTRHTTVLAQTRAFAVPPQTAAPPTPPPSHRLRSFLKGIFSIALTCLIVMACTLTAHFMGAASYSQAVSSLQNQPEFPSARSIFRTPYIGKLSSLNPFAAPDAQAADLEGLLFGRLVSLDKYDGVAQGIANSWGFSSDDLHWTFHIDPLAAFSDTSPVTSWDVAASFDYALSAPSAPTACPFFGLIKDADQLQTHRRASLLGDSLTIVDSTTLIVTVARPVPYFLTTLAAPCGSIVASKDLARWGENAFGAEIAHIAFSGVYAVESYNPDQSMTFVYSSFSFPRPSSVSERITVQSYASVAASYAAYKAGRLDMSPVPDELSTRQLRRYSTTLNLAHPLTLHYYGMNYLAKPFDNVAIRRAFALALDKRELAEFSQGLPTDSLLGSWSLDTTPAGGGDLLHAKESLLQGLQEEGLSSVSQLPPIVFTYEAGQPNLASEVELARLRWQEVLDIKVTLRAVANLDQTLVATHGNASLQLWAADYTPSYLDPYALVGSPFAQGSPLNAVNYGQNTSADAASQQALQNSLSTYLLASISVRGRLQIYQQAEQSLLADVAWLPIYMVTHAYAVAQGALPPFGRDGNPWGAMDYCTGIPPC